ncbi:hypothetical protein ACF0H5_006178 [Mactra antiquata]
MIFDKLESLSKSGKIEDKSVETALRKIQVIVPQQSFANMGTIKDIKIIIGEIGKAKGLKEVVL